MCGINGIYKKAGAANETDIKLMSSAIVHRGPDEAGFIINKNRKVALSNLRLSIMDLKNGHQPIYNEDNSIVIVFNGEIYDIKQHKKSLMERGHIIRTDCDTEIVLHLYEEHGMEFLNIINGEFALIIWDENKNQMYAARDYFGIKPLFYYESDQEILLSSEVKGILALDRVERKFSPFYILSTFMTLYSKTDSIIDGVYSIRPGHYLKVSENGSIEDVEYWKPEFEPDNHISFREAEEGIRFYFEKAIKRRLVSDVPVALYLSGGIDSTLVCGVMSKYKKDLKAFNIGFMDEIFDESGIAEKTAEFYNVEFSSVKCTMEMMARQLERTIYYAESIISNPHCVAKNMLSEHVHNSGYKVCLTGEGSDEFFAGYPYFKLEYIWREALKNGADIKKLSAMKEMFYKEESSSEHVMWDRDGVERDASSFLKYPSYFYHRANGIYDLLIGLFNQEAFGNILNSSVKDIFERNYDIGYINSLSPLNASRYMALNQLHSYMIPLLGDRTEMANSVEGRVPFLDRELISFASRLPAEYLLKTVDGLSEKYVLREAFSDIVPPHMKKRKKHTFLSPSWGDLLETEYGMQLRYEFLNNKAIRENEFFNFKNVKKVTLSREAFSESDPRRRRLDMPVGMILSMQILDKKFIKNKMNTNTNIKMVDRSIK